MNTDVDIWLERISSLRSSLVRKAATGAGLQFIHAEILEYLDRCNRYSNTAQALTDYLGLTKGSVSQSLKLLEGKGYIKRSPCPDDKRASRLSLTDHGRQTLETVLSELPSLKGREETVPVLKQLLKDMQQEHGLRAFGVCHSCGHFETLESGDFRCGLTGEGLSKIDSGKICREHSF